MAAGWTAGFDALAPFCDTGGGAADIFPED
jgi:hypothetical protein